MTMTVKVTTPPVAVELMAKIRATMATAAEPVLAAAVEGAPYEEVPRHDVHLNATGFITPMSARADGSDAVAVGFTAYWAKFQEFDEDYDHTHGHPHFLELAMLEGADGWLAEVAEGVRAALREGAA